MQSLRVLYFFSSRSHSGTIRCSAFVCVYQYFTYFHSCSIISLQGKAWSRKWLLFIIWFHKRSHALFLNLHYFHISPHFVWLTTNTASFHASTTSSCVLYILGHTQTLNIQTLYSLHRIHDLYCPRKCMYRKLNIITYHHAMWQIARIGQRLGKPPNSVENY